MAVYVGYEGAKNCTDGPQPGARGMMQWFLAKYRSVGGTNLGIYNCRTVRGGTTTSLHGEGRAVDLGINPHGASYGTELAGRLKDSSKELGIQCVIWNRKIWSGAHPHAGWRDYGGSNAHVDHLHVELSWATARKSAGDVVALLEEHVGSGSSEPGEPTLRRGSRGDAVKRLQSLLNDLGYPVGAVDGIFGPRTETAVKDFQRDRGLTVDGIVGPKTWAALLGSGRPG